jgi:hypothetical protein
VCRNVRQDSSSTNNALNNNSRSSPAGRRITTTTTMVVVAAAAAIGVAPPTHLPPRVRGPPTSTHGLTLFSYGRSPRGGGQRPIAPPSSAGYAGRRSSLWSSIACWATLHASAHSPCLVADSSTSGSSGVVRMDGLMGSTFAGQLLQHHDHGSSCSHRLGG